MYDTLLLQLESGMSRLETEVKKWQDEILSNETKLHTLAQKSALMDVWQRRAEAELKVGQQLQYSMATNFSNLFHLLSALRESEPV